MTRLPAENLTVGEGITTGTTSVVGFPFTSSLPTPICPHQFLVTPDIGMIVGFPSTFTPPPCSLPRLFNNELRKRHNTHPYYNCVKWIISLIQAVSSRNESYKRRNL